MTSIDCDWKLRGEEGEDSGANSGSASGVCQISRGGEELLADCDFLSGETFVLLGKLIAFSHIVSKTRDVSLQSRIMEIPDCPVNEASTGVGRMEDLEGVVLKEMWFCEIGSSTGVGVEIARVNFCRRTLATFDLWIKCFGIIPDPFAGMSCPSFFVIDPGGFFRKRVIFYPPIQSHPLVVFVHNLSVITLLRTVDIGAGYPDLLKDDSSSLFFFRSAIFFILCDWCQFVLDCVRRQFFSVGPEGPMEVCVVGGIMFVNVVAVFRRTG
jgi:hypothetical protein